MPSVYRPYGIYKQTAKWLETNGAELLYTTNDKYGICFGSSLGPWFGGSSNIGFKYDYSKENNCYSNFGVQPGYQDSLGKGKSIFTGNLDNNNKYYKINEIEAFKLYK